MVATKTIFRITKLIYIILLFIILGEIIYLFSSQTINPSSKYKNTESFKFCDKYQNLGSKQKCWDDLINETLKKEGLDSAFNLVDQLYSTEPEFVSDCHGFTHLLGQKAYELFLKNQKFNVSSKASYCGFGFYHAFMESLLHTSGDLNQARKLCDDVGRQTDQNELARLSCFHGIGHGLLEDVPNPVLRGDTQSIIKEPLALCVDLSESEVEIYRCASGVFNVLAIYFANPKTGLIANKEDPYLICHTQPRRSFKEACYDQMNSFVLSLSQGDLSKAAKFTKTIKEDDLASAAIHGLAGAYGQANVAKINYDEVVKLCQNLELRLTPSCLEGFLLGMIEGGKPGEEYMEGFRLCQSEFLKENERSNCYNTLVWNVSVTNPGKLTDICSNLEQKYRQNCNVN